MFPENFVCNFGEFFKFSKIRTWRKKVIYTSESFKIWLQNCQTWKNFHKSHKKLPNGLTEQLPEIISKNVSRTFLWELCVVNFHMNVPQKNTCSAQKWSKRHFRRFSALLTRKTYGMDLNHLTQRFRIFRSDSSLPQFWLHSSVVTFQPTRNTRGTAPSLEAHSHNSLKMTPIQKGHHYLVTNESYNETLYRIEFYECKLTFASEKTVSVVEFQTVRTEVVAQFS